MIPTHSCGCGGYDLCRRAAAMIISGQFDALARHLRATKAKAAKLRRCGFEPANREAIATAVAELKVANRMRRTGT